MSNRTVRLLNSLKLLGHVPDGWLFRGLSGAGQRIECVDGTLNDRSDELRRAFPLADAVSVEALAAICSLVPVPAGAPLVVRGEVPDAVYIIVFGGFAAYGQAPDGQAPNGQAADGQEILLDRFGTGDIIGDIGFITGEVREATIRALRNSEVLRISKLDLQTAAARCPGVLLTICSAVVQRLQRARPASAKPFKLRTFCVVPADASIDTRPVVQKFAETLEAFGTVTVVSGDQGSGRTSARVSEIERRFDFVLFQTDCGPTAWTKFCLRQCDSIVLLAQGDAEPSDCDALGPGHNNVPGNTPLSLMLRWQDAIVPARTAAWLTYVKPGGHHHIRSSRDIERASRLIAGRGLGLVLSGGGARALAHIGVIDALTKHDVRIDAIGGTSIGAIVAAVFALEWDLTHTVRSLAAAFSRRRFSDFAVPRTALLSERAFVRTLGRCFGDLAIEDSPIPLFCVSTNLTEGVSTTHRSGRMETWLRATSAVPGICPPIIEQNVVYVDGGVLNNMPIDAIRDFGVASVIAVDVGASLQGQARSDGLSGLPNILDLLWRVGTIGSDTAANRIRRDGDVVIRPEVGDVGLFGWDAHEKAIAAGHQAALDHLDEIKAAMGRVVGA